MQEKYRILRPRAAAYFPIDRIMPRVLEYHGKAGGSAAERTPGAVRRFCIIKTGGKHREERSGMHPAQGRAQSKDGRDSAGLRRQLRA